MTSKGRRATHNERAGWAGAYSPIARPSYLTIDQRSLSRQYTVWGGCGGAHAHILRTKTKKASTTRIIRRNKTYREHVHTHMHTAPYPASRMKPRRRPPQRPVAASVRTATPPGTREARTGWKDGPLSVAISTQSTTPAASFIPNPAFTFQR